MKKLLIPLAAALIPAHASFAATLQLLPDADAAMRDTAPGFNYGSAFNLPVGVSAMVTPHNHGLFRFNLSGIPANAAITSVTLNLIVVQNRVPPAQFDLNRVLVNWVESEVTWNNRTASTAWAAAGAQSGTEYVTTPSATGMIDLIETTNAFTSPGMLADVQAWQANPGTNFGWILIATDEIPATGKQIGSRENAGNEPLLTVEYTLPAPPPTLTVLPAANGQFRFRFSAEADHGYTVQFKTDLRAANWNFLSDVDPSPTPAVIEISDPFTESNRFYRVRMD